MDRYNAQSALIVVDVQNDFADPRGALSVRGGESIVLPLNAEIDRALEAGALVVYTQDWHPPDTPHFAKDGGVWPVHCIGDTWGAELHPALRVCGPVVRKGVEGGDGYSGFCVRDPLTGATTETGLAAMLRERGVRRVVITGLATDYCVKETAIDAAHLKFEALILRSLVRAVELARGDASRAFQAMRRAGATIA